MTRPGSDAAAWLRSAISYQIERNVMSEDGFVERPATFRQVHGPNSMAARLRATADNGKAIRTVSYLSGDFRRMPGYKLHVARQPDGTYLAWCERIEPVKATP